MNNDSYGSTSSLQIFLGSKDDKYVPGKMADAYYALMKVFEELGNKKCHQDFMAIFKSNLVNNCKNYTVNSCMPNL